MMAKTLGQTLRFYRGILNLTLRQVEESVGISNAYLSQLENDKIKKPSANALYKLKTLYGCDLDELLSAAGYIDSNSNSSNTLNVLKMTLTEEEQNKLLEYLAFLRSRKNS